MTKRKNNNKLRMDKKKYRLQHLTKEYKIKFKIKFKAYKTKLDFNILRKIDLL